MPGRRDLLLAIGPLLAAPSVLRAQPIAGGRPVRVIVPFPPGGVTDSIARITAEWLTQRLGQPVVADNRPGASGAIAADLVARAEPDGYTLFSAATPQLAIVPYVQKISYDPVKDFAPISIVGTNAFALGCNVEKTPVKSLRVVKHKQCKLCVAARKSIISLSLKLVECRVYRVE